jgi:hypothetical protein
MSAKIEMTDVFGNIFPVIPVAAKTGITTLPTLRLLNTGDAEAVDVLLSVSNIDWSFSGAENWQGQEIVSEQMVEAYQDSAWVPIGGALSTPGNYITIESIPAGSHVDIPLQINVPADAQTRGMVRFVIVGSM